MNLSLAKLDHMECFLGPYDGAIVECPRSPMLVPLPPETLQGHTKVEAPEPAVAVRVGEYRLVRIGETQRACWLWMGER